MAETWVLNATISFPSSALSGEFTSSGTNFTRIRNVSGGLGGPGYLAYVTVVNGLANNIKVYAGRQWVNDAYRTLVFDPAPTGAMLTWLQANGVKQSAPEPETPTNSCMVDGTVYGIKTGTALVNGTAQTIYNGRTLVAGTGYDIVLSKSGFTVTITGSGAAASESINAYVIINGEHYTAPATLTVEAGTTIEAHANSILTKSHITLNGAQVKRGTAISYEYTVTKNTNVTLSLQGGGNMRYGVIDITTT